MAGTLHEDEIAAPEPLVRRLLRRRFPAWADRSLEAAGLAGTDHVIYRLGDDLSVRLPRRASAVAQAEKEARWLDRLAPRLPLAVPAVVARGEPDEDFPWPWSIRRWIAGQALTGEVAALAGTGRALARFVAALQAIETADAPAPGAHNFWRGAPLGFRDAATRKAIAASGDLADPAVIAEAWRRDMAAPTHQRAPVWIHGDLCPGNLVVRGGRLAGVVDFGGLTAGDPACDLMVAWNGLSGEGRAAFRAALVVDDAAWARGRAWALSVAVIQWPYYRDSHPGLAAQAAATVAAVLADHGLADRGLADRGLADRDLA